MKIEVFYTPTCPNCPPAKAALRKFIKEHKEIEYSEINAYDHQDRVMELGFRMVPTIVVDGKVWMTGVPTEEQLKGLLSK